MEYFVSEVIEFQGIDLTMLPGMWVSVAIQEIEQPLGERTDLCLYEHVDRIN